MINHTLPQHPDVLALLPLVYLVWANGNLSDDEVALIREQYHGLELDDTCRDYLDAWLDPQQPPSAHALQDLLHDLQQHAQQAAIAEQPSLVAFAAALAQAQGGELPPKQYAALEQIATALGISSHEAVRQLLAHERQQHVSEVPTTAFPVARLQQILDGDQVEIRQQVRAILSQFAYRYDLDSATYRELVLDWCRELARQGIGRLGFPLSVGGQNDYGKAFAAFESIATHDLSLLVKFGVQFGLFGGSVQQLGTEKHHQAYLPAIASLDLPGCFAMTETGHGSNVYDIETTAHYDAATQTFVIHTPNPQARKDYIGNAACHGQLATVFAQLHIDTEHYGVHAFLVPIRNSDGTVCSGVEIEDCGQKLGLNGVDNGRLSFNQVRIPRDNLLDRFAQVAPDGGYHSPITSPAKRFFTMLSTLVTGRISICVASLSVSKSALAIAVKYANRRHQFGPTGGAEVLLLDYLTHQRRLIPRLATSYALDFANKHLVRCYLDRSEGQHKELEALAAGLKAYGSWHATDTVQACREACGGQGYLAENRFAALKADSDIFTTFEGDNTVLLQLLAKSMLGGYKQQFGGMSLFGMARYVATQAVTTVTELNPVVTRNTDPDHLRSRDFQLGALRWREQRLLGTLARRLKSRIDKGMDSFAALLETQDHMLKTAHAHIERVILEQFVAGCENLSEEEEIVDVLNQLCSLYALSTIEKDSGWFLQQGYLEGNKAKAIRKQVNVLCQSLRVQTEALVNAFGIPQSLLAAPITHYGRDF